jgi:sodium-independent sulfate anion transporter 11
LTPAFFYIPDTTLSAIIIHAVLGLVSELDYVKQLWKIQFWDFAVFFTAVVGIFFSTIENWNLFFNTLNILSNNTSIGLPKIG